MKITAAVTAAVAMLVTGLAIVTTAGASHGNHALRHFEGKVVSVDAAAQTFRLKDHERGTATFEVTDDTRFEGLSGFSALTEGLKRVEVKAKRVDGAWVARKVERSARRGHHAGRTGDDNAGGGRHGADDPACHDKGDDHGDDADDGHHGGDDDSGEHHGGSDDS
jgi:hypothetical protein